MDPHPAPWVAIGIAFGTVIVVPTAVWIGRKIAAAWHEHRVRLLGEVFVTREEFSRQFSKLNEAQTAQHAENRATLDQLRMDGKEREGKLTAMLEGIRQEVREDTKELRESVAAVHGRVDSVLGLLGNRRKP